MSTLPIALRGVCAGTKVIHLSQLLGAMVVAPSGEPIGRVDDIIVALPGADTQPQPGVTIVWDQQRPHEGVGDC